MPRMRHAAAPLPGAEMTTSSIARLLLLCLALGPAGVQAQTVYRCAGEGGRVIFQQAPCQGEGRQLEVPPINVAEPYRPDASLVRSMEARSAIERGVVRVGMTAAEVQQAVGAPRAINRSVSEAGVAEQLVYRTPDGGRMDVYLRDGLVEGGSTYSRGRTAHR
jgi:hypothetical protein